MLKCVSARISVVTDSFWLNSKLGSCACALAQQPERQISRQLIYPAFQPTASGTTLDQTDSSLENSKTKTREQEMFSFVAPQL